MWENNAMTNVLVGLSRLTIENVLWSCGFNLRVIRATSTLIKIRRDNPAASGLGCGFLRHWNSQSFSSNYATCRASAKSGQQSNVRAQLGNKTGARRLVKFENLGFINPAPNCDVLKFINRHHDVFLHSKIMSDFKMQTAGCVV